MWIEKWLLLRFPLVRADFKMSGHFAPHNSQRLLGSIFNLMITFSNFKVRTFFQLPALFRRKDRTCPDIFSTEFTV